MHRDVGIEIDQQQRLPPGAAILLYLALALLSWGAVILAAWGLWKIF